MRSVSCGNSLQIHSATPEVEDAEREVEVGGMRSPAASSSAVTTAAPVMNSAFMMLSAAMMRARAASSLRCWMIA